MKNKLVPATLLFGSLSILLLSCTKRINTGKQNTNDTSIAAVTSPVKSAPLWKELPHDAFKELDTAKMHFKRYKLFALDSAQLQAILLSAPKEKQRNADSLKVTLELPRPDSGFMRFSVYRTSTMDSALEARYPLLRTFGGQGTNDRTASIRLDFNQNGFHAYVISQAGEWFVQPAAKGITHQFLLCFFKQDAVIPDRKAFESPDIKRK